MCIRDREQTCQVSSKSEVMGVMVWLIWQGMTLPPIPQLDKSDIVDVLSNVSSLIGNHLHLLLKVMFKSFQITTRRTDKSCSMNFYNSVNKHWWTIYYAIFILITLRHKQRTFLIWIQSEVPRKEPLNVGFHTKRKLISS